MIVLNCNLKNFKLNQYKLSYTFLSNKDFHVDMTAHDRRSIKSQHLIYDLKSSTQRPWQ